MALSFPLPSLPLLCLPLPSPPLSSPLLLPLRSRAPKSSYGVWGSAVSGVWSGAPAEIEFGAF